MFRPTLGLWLLTSIKSFDAPQTRYRAILDYARQAGKPDPIPVIVPYGGTPTDIAKAAYNTIRDKLTDSPLPDAIFTGMDMHAFGAIRAISDAGYQVGRDVALSGYDDIWPSEFVSPPLTTVHQPLEEMGTTAADIMIDIIEDKIRPGRSVIVSPELSIRHSSSFAGKNTSSKE